MPTIGERLTAMARRLIPGRPAATVRPLQAQSVDSLLAILEAQEEGGLTISHAKLTKGQVKRYFRRWQYSAATAIADAMSLVEYEVQTLQRGQWAEDEAHPLAALLRSPNPWMTFREMVYYLALDLVYVGEHYWYIARNGVNEPAQLWPLFGEMKPQLSEEAYLTGYTLKYQTATGPREKRYEIEEIVPFRLPMLQNAHEGFSPMRAAAGSVKLDDELLKARWYAFRQGIRPLLVLALSERDPDKRRQLLDEFHSLYAGTRESGKTIAINRETMELKDFGRTPREMDFSKSAAAVREAITSMFRVPAVLMGLTRDIQNRATAEAAEYVFAKWNIRPKLALVEDRINMNLARPYYGVGVRVKFYNPVPSDRDQDRADQDLLAKHYALTINELREIHGYEPVPWGDRPLVPISLLPLGEEPATKEKQALIAAAERAALAGDRAEFARRPRRPAGYGDRAKRLIWQRVNDARLKFQPPYRRAWARIFRRLEKEFLAAFESARDRQGVDMTVWTKQDVGDIVDDVLDPGRLSQLFYNENKPWIVRGLIIGGMLDGEIADVPGRETWGPDAAALVQYAQQYNPAYYHGIATTTQKQMTAILAAGIEARATWDEMRAAITKKFGEMRDSRAANIATTETTKLFNGGAQAFREEFEVEYKQWVASHINTRDTHLEAAAQPPIPNKELFEVGADRMPYPGAGSLAEEVCNCFCMAVAVPKP